MLQNTTGGTLPNLYKMKGCADAIQAVEFGRQKVYDAVIKMIPDSKFWSVCERDVLIQFTYRILAREKNETEAV